MQTLAEQEGSSLIQRQQSTFSLTQLGQESLALGAPIRLIHRALRYCALTSTLLPREAYRMEFEPFSGMGPDFLRFRELLPEPEDLVDLGGLQLDFENVSVKSAVNVPDEAVGIDSISGYQPAYLRASLCLTGVSRPDTAWIQFRDAVRQYPLDAVKLLIDSFEPRAQLGGSDRSVGQTIEEALGNSGSFPKSPLSLDEYGSPTVVLSHATDEWLSGRLGMEDPWVLRCGTSTHPARPVTRFPMRDVLQGHTMTIYIENPSLEADIDLLRSVIDSVNADYYSIPFREREKTVGEFLTDNHTRDVLDRTRELVQRFDIRQAMNWFESRE